MLKSESMNCNCRHWLSALLFAAATILAAADPAPRIRAALQNGLPLMGSWNTGKTPAGFHPTWQTETLLEQEDHLILPWFQGPGPQSKWDDRASRYYEKPMAYCARKQLPISFRNTQWEDALLETAEKPEAENGCLIRPDGKVIPRISPFGPVELWYKVGYNFNNNDVLKKLQEIHPNPPLVLVYSNNEPKDANKVSPENCKRLKDLLAANPKLTADKATIGRLVQEAWEKRYRRLIEGLRDALVSKAWKDKLRVIPYTGFNNTFRQRNIMAWHKPRAWDGASVHLYTSDWEVCRDFWVASPQGHVGNIHYSIEQVRKTKPDFFSELSVWYDNDGVVKILEYQKKQTYTDERLRGVIQFVLWGMRPQVLRDYRGYRESRQRRGRSFYVMLNSVERVHYHPILRKFWLQGRILANRRAGAKAANTGKDSLYILDADANRKVNWNNRKAEVPVYPLALEIGRRGAREWLLYIHAPLGDRRNVKVTIPDYKEVLVDAPLGGAFYHVIEKTGKAQRLDDPLTLPGNRAPEAKADSYAVAAGSVLETANNWFMGVRGVLANDWDADGDPLRVSVVQQPAHGTLQLQSDGTFTYKPEAGFDGTDAFTYRLHDGALYSKPARVKIEIQSLKLVVDDTDPGFAEHAVWQSGKLDDARGKDFDYYFADTNFKGGSTATWTFANLAADTYEVFATWPVFSYQQPRKVPYAVFAGERELAVKQVYQGAPPKGEPVNGTRWQSLGKYQIKNGSCRVVLNNAGKGRWVVADAVRLVDSKGQARIIDNGDAGYATVGRWVAGGRGLNGGVRQIRGVKKRKDEDAPRAMWTMKPPTPGIYELFVTWTASSTRTAKARYTITDGSTVKATPSINQSRPPNSLFARGVWWQSLGRFQLTGEKLTIELIAGGDKKKFIADAVGLSGPIPMQGSIVDNRDTDFVGPKRTEGNRHGYNGNSLRTNNAGKAMTVATYKFHDLQPGTYRVYATWCRTNFNIADVPYRMTAGDQELKKTLVDQTKLPDDRAFGGVQWEDLGTVEVPATSLNVEVGTTGKDGGKVVLDAVWIVRED